jgi:predicted Rossmann fold nucleotide-binding protein DprA/Smf involved in DNA uptake
LSSDTFILDDSASDYPKRLRDHGLCGPYPNLWMIGHAPLLNRPLLGMLCSARCPGQIILQTYDMARALRAASVPVIGGFHSPMEKESLDLLLRGTQSVVICPARSLNRMRVPANWKTGIDAQRVLVVSPFKDGYRRVTAGLAEERNKLVAALANEVVVLHANPGGRTDRLCRQLMADGKTVWTLDARDNADIIRAGARASTPEALASAWRNRRG